MGGSGEQSRILDESVSTRAVRFATVHDHLHVLRVNPCWWERCSPLFALLLQRLVSFGVPHDGLSHWTTVPDKEFDPSLFRNGGMSYWEVEKPKIAAKRRVDPPAPSRNLHHLEPRPIPVAAFVVVQADTPQQIYSAAESSPPHQATNGASRTPPVAAPVPASAEPTPLSAASTSAEPPLPPLTANIIADTKGPSPTNAALEKGITATTSENDKLQTALAEIDRLRAQLAEATGPVVTGLRKRGGAQAQAGVDTAVEKTKEVVAAAQGIPIEIVGGLLLAVFVLTYLFF